MDPHIEEASMALVREFLSRRGLKNALEQLDAQVPRTHDSITSRSELAKLMNLEKLVKKNKESPNALVTMLEIMVRYFLRKEHVDEDADSPTPKPARPSDGADKNPLTVVSKLSDSFIGTSSMMKPAEKTSRAHTAKGTRTANTSSPAVVSPGPKQSVAGSRDLIAKAKALTMRSVASEDDEKSRRTWRTSSFEESDEVPIPRPRAARLRDHPLSAGLSPMTVMARRLSADAEEAPPVKKGEITLEDFSSNSEDSDSEPPPPTTKRHIVQPTAINPTQDRAATIDTTTVIALRKLMFGSQDGTFNTEWRMQHFAFSDIKDLQYGLVQFKGGPCGVVAVVQAYVLKYLLFEQKPTKDPLEPTQLQRETALVNALTDILWTAGGGKHCVVALPSARAAAMPYTYKPDKITEKVSMYTCNSREIALQYITRNVAYYFSEGSNSCIYFTYSVVLSHGIDRIKSEIDESNGKLIGNFNYCTQELVNLMLTGVACSNVFDGIQTLGDGKDSLTLRGVNARANIGFLSLFEHYQSCVVGTHLKTPKYPIWVVCSESHFTVLFSTNRDLLNDWRLQRKFDLYFYDELANQQHPYHLSIDTESSFDASAHHIMVSPIEFCIRTRWPNAVISWNSSEPYF